MKTEIRIKKSTSANMGFARCGVEGNLRKILVNTRKKLFPHSFYFFKGIGEFSFGYAEPLC